jgi:membrane-associated protein
MSLRQFSVYNLFSAVLWIGSLLAAGYYFGSLPFVKEHFSLVVYGIVVISLLPPTIGFVYRKVATT